MVAVGTVPTANLATAATEVTEVTTVIIAVRTPPDKRSPLQRVSWCKEIVFVAWNQDTVDWNALPTSPQHHERVVCGCFW